MYEKLQNVTLKSGENVELGILRGPDSSELGAQVRSLLGHKEGIWLWQIEQSLTVESPAESRFYILIKQGKPIANIMAVERDGIGIFGHVYTVPEERRKGAADIIHHHQIKDFKSRGGRALYLGTGYDTHPYHLYQKYGFKGVEPKSGYMFWFAQSQESFESDVFAPAPVRHEPLGYQHWPSLPALSMMKHPARVRVLNMNIVGVRSTEGGALATLHAMSTAAPGNLAESRAWVAVSEKSNVPVAIASIAPQPRFDEEADVVDLFCAPGFEKELPALLEKTKLSPGKKSVAYADILWPEKADALKQAGFKLSGTLENFVGAIDKHVNVEIYAR
jgi:hypothetical protein